MSKTCGNKRKRNLLTLKDQHCSLDRNSVLGESDAFLSKLRELYEERTLCDIEFNVCGQMFNAHRVILAASNSFLGAMILSQMKESEQRSIQLEADPTLFRYILDYIYGIPLDLPSSQLIPLLGLASCYSMIGLRDRLGEILCGTLSIDNCCSVFAAADSYDCANVKNQAQELIFTKFAYVSMTDGFLSLEYPALEFILKSDEILDCDEALIFDATVRWLNKSQENAVYATAVLKLVRYPLMDSFLLSDVIKIHPLMQGAERANLLMEAFEHHALRAAGRIGLISERTINRRQSCSFTQSTLLDGHEDAVSALVSYGDWLISGSWDTTIKIWVADGWLCIKTLSDHVGAIRALCVCGDKLVSCSDDGVIKVWSPGSWTCVRSMEGHDGAANALVQCKGRLASAGDDGTIKLWNSMTWSCEVTVHNIAVPTAENEHFDEEGNFFVEGLESLPSGYNGGNNANTNNDEPPEEENEDIAVVRVGVMSMAVFEDTLISGGDDSLVRVWDTNNWSYGQILRAHKDEVWSIRINSDGTMITGSVDGTIRIWRKQNGLVCASRLSTLSRLDHQVAHADDHSMHDQVASFTQRIVAVSAHPSNSSLSRNEPIGSTSHQRQSEWECIYSVSSDGSVYSLCCLDGKVVSAGSSNKICVWKSALERDREAIVQETRGQSARSSNSSTDSKASAMLKWFETEEAGVWSLTVWKGRLISGGVDGTVRVWM